jgi:hypothetical protein
MKQPYKKLREEDELKIKELNKPFSLKDIKEIPDDFIKLLVEKLNTTDIYNGAGYQTAG